MKKPYILSIKVVIRDKEGRCLLIKRSAKSRGNPGRWDLPGGKVEKGEDFEAALKREVHEETGLSIEITGVLGACESESEDRKIAYLFMKGTAEPGEIKLSDEHEDFAWVSENELPNYDLREEFIPFVKAK